MRNRLTTFLALLMLVGSASAQSVMRFHVKLTDGRTALLANPKFDEMKLTDEQVRRAANDRVLLLDQTSGTHWTWLMLSEVGDKPAAEHKLDARGVAASGQTADVGLTVVGERTLRVRCLRADCTLLATGADDKQASTRLAKGEGSVVPIDSFVELSFADR